MKIWVKLIKLSLYDNDFLHSFVMQDSAFIILGVMSKKAIPK